MIRHYKLDHQVAFLFWLWDGEPAYRKFKELAQVDPSTWTELERLQNAFEDASLTKHGVRGGKRWFRIPRFCACFHVTKDGDRDYVAPDNLKDFIAAEMELLQSSGIEELPAWRSERFFWDEPDDDDLVHTKFEPERKVFDLEQELTLKAETIVRCPDTPDLQDEDDTSTANLDYIYDGDDAAPQASQKCPMG